MKPSFKVIPLLGLAGLIVAGCGQGSASVQTRGAKVFQSAPPEAKAAWETAVAAVKTNGWVPALQSLEALAKQPSLTPDQNKVVYDFRTVVNEQMFTAANKGDANAVEAIKQLRSSFRR